MFQTKPSECGAHRKLLYLTYHNSDSLINTVLLLFTPHFWSKMSILP